MVPKEQVLRAQPLTAPRKGWGCWGLLHPARDCSAPIKSPPDPAQPGKWYRAIRVGHTVLNNTQCANPIYIKSRGKHLLINMQIWIPRGDAALMRDPALISPHLPGICSPLHVWDLS